jgi:tetratricopeptide (TPR) repeat protein
MLLPRGWCLRRRSTRARKEKQSIPSIYQKWIDFLMRLRSLAILCVIAPSLLAVDADSIRQAQRELFATRFDSAAQRYAELVKSDPSWSPGYYGWVRALLGARRAMEAYAAADAAQKAVPGTAPAEVALGMATYRRGELTESERHFRRALRLDAAHSGALLGLARVLTVISKFKMARELNHAAYMSAPDDPDCILAGLANQQDGEEHVATLERVLAVYDPSTHEARELRAHIASDRAVGSRKRTLVSPYQHYEIKLVDLMNGPNSKRGVGISVEINQKKFTLLLDTGASGIAISPKSAKRSGLEGLGEETVEARVLATNPPQTSIRYSLKRSALAI